jgi:hypothetical protein
MVFSSSLIILAISEALFSSNNNLKTAVSCLENFCDLKVINLDVLLLAFFFLFVVINQLSFEHYIKYYQEEHYYSILILW